MWKKKGDLQAPRKCRGITLVSHTMKLLKRILDGRIRKRIEQELGEEQHGFRKGRGTTDGMFALRQLRTTDGMFVLRQLVTTDGMFALRQLV